MSEFEPRPEMVTLKVGDVFRKTMAWKGRRLEEGTVHLYKVKDINSNGTRGDYLWANCALGQSGVPSSLTLTLEKGERKGKTATFPCMSTSEDGMLIHRIEKAEAPKGTKWSYEH